MYFIFGVFGMLMKSYRFIYMVISLEMCMIGLVIYCMTFLSDGLFFLLLSLSLVSSVTGLLMLVELLTSYGGDYVKF